MLHSKAVFLDRDGTINIDFGYVCSPDRIELIPGAATAIGHLRRAGYVIVVVTNQSAIARGYATESQVMETNRHLEKILLAENPEAIIDLLLFCGDSPDSSSLRRKPAPGMILEAKQRLQHNRGIEIDLSRSWVVGDKSSDLKAGLSAGIPKSNCLLVLTGEGEKTIEESPGEFGIDCHFPSILEASEQIVSFAD